MKHAGNDESMGLSYAMRLLIHFMGDIHQPLHCLTRINDDLPVGDKGGNAFKLPNHYSADNLHSVWDAVVYEFHTNDKLVSLHKCLTNHFSPIPLPSGPLSAPTPRSSLVPIASLTQSIRTSTSIAGLRRPMFLALRMHTQVSKF